jgi:hypothetical protein
MGGRNNAALIDPMKMSGIPGRFFSGAEKAAVCETGTEGYTGEDKKSLCVLFFDMSGNQSQPTLMKNKPHQNLITEHKTP